MHSQQNVKSLAKVILDKTSVKKNYVVICCAVVWQHVMGVVC